MMKGRGPISGFPQQDFQVQFDFEYITHPLALLHESSFNPGQNAHRTILSRPPSVSWAFPTYLGLGLNPVGLIFDEQTLPLNILLTTNSFRCVTNRCPDS